MTILPLDEFRASPDAQFSKGTWVVEYFDRTHLRTGNYLSLGKIDIEERTPDGQHLFRFYPRCIKKLKKCICNAWKNGTGTGDPKKAAEIILDQLSESMVRLGLLQPNFEISDCKSINERNFAVVVLDTNALRDSAVRHLKEQFPNTQMWIIIPTVTLMEIGEKVCKFKQ